MRIWRTKDPYASIRWKLLAINMGALFVLWITLLSLVYSLMTHELYQVLDSELRGAAGGIIRGYAERPHAPLGNSVALNQLDIRFSLWHMQYANGQWTSAFIDGNPFINVSPIYTAAQQNPDGLFETVSIRSVRYRSFTAMVHTERGLYLIRALKPIASINATLNNLLWILGVAGLAALILTIAMGLWLTGKSLAPMIASWKRQQQFVGDASHELRTPLAIIKANLEVLLRSPDHKIESEMTYLANAYEEVGRTTTLIQNLLTLARADSQEQLIERVPVDMNHLIRAMADTVQPLATAEDKEIVATVPEFPCQVLGDVARLRQLLLILVDNAMRYSKSGAKITLKLECDTLHTRITVADTGIGIDARLLPRVFDRFVRADTTRHRQGQGTGLGLAIAKWIVQAHNGTIEIASKLDQGTTVTITLPP